MKTMEERFRRERAEARGIKNLSNVFDLQHKSMEADNLARSRELMNGRYTLTVPPGASFKDKLARMSNEEVAYFLYLNRHQEVKTKEIVDRAENKRIGVLKTVLRDTILSNNAVYQKTAVTRKNSSESEESTKEKKEPKPQLSLAEKIRAKQEEAEEKAKKEAEEKAKNDSAKKLTGSPGLNVPTEESEEGGPVQATLLRMTPAQKAEQLRQLIKKFRSNKQLKGRSREEIEIIAKSYQQLDFAAKKAQIEEHELESIGMKIPKKQKIKNSQ